jgi:uncharacterized protein (DUF1501 family)
MAPINRRDFFRMGCCGMAVGYAASFSRFGVMNAFAQTQTDYKALVCIFLGGGNDSNNMIVPVDNAGYSAYSKARAGLALSQGSLLPIQPTSAGTPFGLHAKLPELQQLFNQKHLAVMANVGTLITPVTKKDVQSGRVQLPDNLLSHLDQQLQMQSAQFSGGLPEIGWGGRVVEVPSIQALNAAALLPACVSLDGENVFADGRTARPAIVPPGNVTALDGINLNNTADSARYNAMQQMLTFDSGLSLVQTANGTMQNAFQDTKALSDAFAGASPLKTVFPQNSYLASQLQQVARIIQVRQALGLGRQIFFVQTGGYDTHSDQLNAHNNLYADLSKSLNAFYLATQEMGVQQQVTSFTLSDFGRALQPDSTTGTDHAWGSHLLVLGGAVHGGDLYGKFPTLALGGPDDATTQGRWIPTTSLDQYGATLASWFGVPDADLVSVFPNLGNFTTPKLTFMG